MKRTIKTFDILQRLVQIPTAPFREHWIAAELDRILAEIPNLEFEADRFGNRIARLRRGAPSGPTATFVAHLDHPGFLPVSSSPNGSSLTCHAVFEGRVRDAFFEDAPVRLFRSPGDSGIPGRVVDFTREDPKSETREITIQTASPADGAVIGMWDVPIFDTNGDLIHARVCDDLAGCAAIISALSELSAADSIDVAAIFTRGEEAGFCGALCLMNEEPLHPLIPKDTTYISVETSSEMPGVAAGSGAIIRTGDRSSTFDGPITDRLWSCARREGITATRRLMDRGTCEATAFTRAGVRAGGVCIPLRNYHNMNFETMHVDQEAISRSDAENLSALIETLARTSGKEEPVITSIEFGRYLEKGQLKLKEDPSFIEESKTTR